MDFSLTNPDLCKLKCSTAEGSMTFTVSKPRLSLRLTKPYSEERKQKASERAKKYGLKSPVSIVEVTLEKRSDI
jgi:hypothetical protein